MKVVTICGSLKFIDDMKKIASELSLSGNCVLLPVLDIDKKKLLKKDIKNLKTAHFRRIELSDSIVVVNKDNYIGESTELEIEYARFLGREVIYYYK